MRYLTPELLARYRSPDNDVAEVASGQWEQAAADYNAELNALRPFLPAGVRTLLDHEVDLRPVKGRLALLGAVIHAEILDDGKQRPLGVVPVLGAADVLVAVQIAQPDAHPVVVETQARQDEQHQLDVARISSSTCSAVTNR